MKRIFLIAAAIIALASSSYAQITTDPNGNVGIGTATPGTKLEVNGAVANNRNWYYFAGPGDTNHAIGNIAGDGEQLRFFYFLDLNQTTGGGQSRLYIDLAGNVGLGTTTPLSMFQVDGGCTKANIGDASGIGLNYGTSYLGFNAARSSGNWTMHADGVHNGGGLTYASIYGDLYFAPIASTGTTDQVLSDATVKSRIALRVEHDGTTYAKKVIVELTGWPDYVFKPTYSLKPLSEVKTYIDLNHHLPEMPSEKEVADKGVDLGEMNKLLTKKVEELTLYLIEKDKKEKIQEERLNRLEAIVTTLSSDK